MYWKLVADGVILSIGISNPPYGTAITADEYQRILQAFRSQTFEPGYIYELLDGTLEWRITPIPEPDPPEPEPEGNDE